MTIATMLAPDTMEHLPLLGQAECEAITQTVIELSPWWLVRHPIAPFFTLGAASYLDVSAEQGTDTYLDFARKVNPVLDEAFTPLFERVMHVLSERLHAPVELAEHQARPGFHVFLGDPAFEQPVARVHVDLQDRPLAWGDVAPDAGLSFTLPVALPASGGGMDVWLLDQDEWLAMSLPERKKALTTYRRRDVRYALGSLVLHTGRLVHRIAATAAVTIEDRRVTLQGHGVRIAGRWYLYW